MNLIIEAPQEISGFCANDINESTGKQEKSYFIQGIFSTANRKNRNGRVYPKNLWEREIEAYQKEIRENTINTLGEWEHPPRHSIDPMKAVMRIIELKMDGDYVFGKAKILNNGSHETEQLKALIKEGMKIGVSSRGIGNVGSDGVVKSFKLITYDVVSNPSDYNANLNGIHESFMFENGIAKNIEYSINESGLIEQKKVINIDTFRLQSELQKLIQNL